MKRNDKNGLFMGKPKSINSEVIYEQPLGVRGLVDLTYTQENSSQVKFIY